MNKPTETGWYWYQDEPVEVYSHNGRLRAAIPTGKHPFVDNMNGTFIGPIHPDDLEKMERMRHALNGGPDPLSPAHTLVGSIRCLVAGFREIWDSQNDEDPDAVYEMLNDMGDHCQRIEKALTPTNDKS